MAAGDVTPFPKGEGALGPRGVLGLWTLVRVKAKPQPSNRVERLAMRMMLKAVMDTEMGNEAIRNGSLAKVIEQVVQQLQPEAAYFAPEDGQRACFMVFDMTDSSQLPVISEPLFQSGTARITIAPCMNLDDLQKGLSQVS
jgi:hypothetical protein